MTKPQLKKITRHLRWANLFTNTSILVVTNQGIPSMVKKFLAVVATNTVSRVHIILQKCIWLSYFLPTLSIYDLDQLIIFKQNLRLNTVSQLTLILKLKERCLSTIRCSVHKVNIHESDKFAEALNILCKRCSRARLIVLSHSTLITLVHINQPQYRKT